MNLRGGSCVKIALKESTLIGENLLPAGSNFFPFRVDPLFRRG